MAAHTAFPTPHLNKINRAIANVKAAQDVVVLEEARDHYFQWIDHLESLDSTGRERVDEMVRLLNGYKDILEVDLIMRRGTEFLRRQKGQLKLDNSVLEEFFARLVDPAVLPGIEGVPISFGPQRAFMSLSFAPTNFAALSERPAVVLKSKDQDFVMGPRVYYNFSPQPGFDPSVTAWGVLCLQYWRLSARSISTRRCFRKRLVLLLG